MPSGPFSGFGTGAFGSVPFGTSAIVTTLLQVLGVLAVRENVVRISFNVAPRFSLLGSPSDASAPQRYTLTPVEGSIGKDGDPTRAVSVIVVEQADDEGTVLDLVLDRPMSPEPGEYDLTLQGLVTADGQTQMPTTTVRFTALFKELVPPIPELVVNNRDIANPQTALGIYDPLPVVEGEDLNSLLGTFRHDSQGDLAFDEGLASYRKRVMRRLVTRKGKFSHLPNYGVSILSHVKQLARAGLREFLAEEAESQILQEPETLSASVVVVIDNDRPDLVRYRIRARTNIGELPDFDIPVSFSSTGE